MTFLYFCINIGLTEIVALDGDREKEPLFLQRKEVLFACIHT